MPFYEKWNPRKGGTIYAGMCWIIENLGYRTAWAKEHGVPEKSVSLHIVDHAKGFVPNNLAWATKGVQSAEQMFKIIANLRHENRTLKQRIRELEKVA